MAWTVLVLAGILEIGWAVGLKYTDGFTRWLPSALTIVAMAGSMWLLAIALRSILIGIAYAVWTGIGAAGTAVFVILLFAEPATALRLASIGLIVAGIAGLKLAA